MEGVHFRALQAMQRCVLFQKVEARMLCAHYPSYRVQSYLVPEDFVPELCSADDYRRWCQQGFTRFDKAAAKGVDNDAFDNSIGDLFLKLDAADWVQKATTLESARVIAPNDCATVEGTIDCNMVFFGRRV
jgi:hypothetical protein